MASYAPNGMSFRALTILIEHIENGGDYPINHHRDAPQRGGSYTKSIQALMERGYIRQRNSKFTTITKHGHTKFCEAAAAWAEFLTRLNLANEAGEIYTLPQFHAEERKKPGRPSERVPAPVASGCGDSVADQQGEAVPTERAETLERADCVNS